MQNPLLDTFSTPFNTPPFAEVTNEHLKPAIRELISSAKSEVESIVSNGSNGTFNNTIEALERSGKQLDRVSSIFFNLNSAETRLQA